jgi:hypothetical protein
MGYTLAPCPKCLKQNGNSVSLQNLVIIRIFGIEQTNIYLKRKLQGKTGQKSPPNTRFIIHKTTSILRLISQIVYIINGQSHSFDISKQTKLAKYITFRRI